MSCFRYSLIMFMCFAGTISCTVYDVDTADNTTLAGSLSRAVNKDRGRLVTSEPREDNAPTYVDYSKSNPILRHDDEYKEDTKYKAVDPFEEDVDFAEYKDLKLHQDEKRRMEDNHELSGTGDKKSEAMSLW